MIESKPEMTLERALMLPLLQNDPTSGHDRLIVKNLKTRFNQEITNYLSEQTEMHKQRQLLRIEVSDINSIHAFKDVVKRTLDKIDDENTVVKTITPQEFRALAQYLSWSYFQATEHLVEDNRHLPQTKALFDIKKLFVEAKKASERNFS